MVGNKNAPGYAASEMSKSVMKNQSFSTGQWKSQQNLVISDVDELRKEAAIKEAIKQERRRSRPYSGVSGVSGSAASSM